MTEMKEAKYCMTANRKKESRNGCSVPTEQPERDMESILNDLQIYVCHEMCRPPEMTEDERKQYCRGCWFEGLVEEIIEEYEKKIKPANKKSRLN